MSVKVVAIVLSAYLGFYFLEFFRITYQPYFEPHCFDDSNINFRFIFFHLFLPLILVLLVANPLSIICLCFSIFTGFGLYLYWQEKQPLVKCKQNYLITQKGLAFWKKFIGANYGFWILLGCTAITSILFFLLLSEIVQSP